MQGVIRCCPPSHTATHRKPLPKAGRLALAKQHYRRVLQRAGAACPLRARLRLGECFLNSGDAGVAEDMYAACLDNSAAAMQAWLPAWAMDGGGVACGGKRCAAAWLGLGLSRARLGDTHAAELCLAEAVSSDPEHPRVWGHLALLALRVGRDADADVALRQALRYGLAAPELLTSLAVAQQQAGRFGAAAALLRRTLSVQDGVQARCRLAAILLASHEYEECQAELVAAAALPADDADRVMLGDILQRLRDAWPHL